MEVVKHSISNTHVFLKRPLIAFISGLDLIQSRNMYLTSLAGNGWTMGVNPYVAGSWQCMDNMQTQGGCMFWGKGGGSIVNVYRWGIYTIHYSIQLVPFYLMVEPSNFWKLQIINALAIYIHILKSDHVWAVDKKLSMIRRLLTQHV